ncbi:hypothetical protein RU639_003713 [Aspergillus parasiticus]
MLLRLHENGELHLSVYVYELEDFVDESALRRAVEALTVNHPILRTTWAESNSGYCQVLLPSSAVSFSSFDGRILNHIQQTKARRPMIFNVAHQSLGTAISRNI